MNAVLNVGLHIDGELALKLSTVLTKIQNLATVIRAHYWFSDTEPTAVVVISRPLTEHELFYLAEQLQQGAIAMLFGRCGILVGPCAEQWGPFDPAKFIMPDGRRANDKS